MCSFDIVSAAQKHAIARDVASPDFFEGALLGNGDLGVVVCTRPDGIVLHLGHNNIWDIRIAEGHRDKIGTFEEVWGKVQDIKGNPYDDPWYQEYMREVTSSYHNYKYPRPYPASSLYLFFDRKEYEVLGHSLDISNGLLTVTLQNSCGEYRYITVFVSQRSDTLYCRTADEAGAATPLFYRIRLIPHLPDEGLPDYRLMENGFFQLLPYNDYAGAMRTGVDKALSVLWRHNGAAAPAGNTVPVSQRADHVGLHCTVADLTEITLQVTQGDCAAVSSTAAVDAPAYDEAFAQSATVWADYWNRSGVKLSDAYLEHLWYTNTYFMRCLLNAHSRCPGQFGNWMYGDIGTAWHGDYHMNYNTQQIFWGLMSSNRQELHLPYIRLAEELLPLSKDWAKDFYRLDGACFPHSAYPVPMSVMPYPSPDWGWEILETPWTVQSLWWHYTYTGDIALLRDRLWPVIREAAVFLAEYMTREGANPHDDDKYHLFPTIVPELYGLSEGLVKNLDGTADLTLTKFIFRSALQAVADLGIEEQEKSLTDKITRILSAYPEYPTADSGWGKVYVSVDTEDPEKVVYNCPANLMQVYPGEDIDAQTATPEELALARNTWKHHYNEGGNDIVFYHMIAARLGVLDLEKFKRHVRYCTLPNETVTDRVTLSGGRYSDQMHFDFMSHMGIWVENFSLYAVVNEALLWGHTDVIELFPNWDKNNAAAFTSLRTKGAFLVDAACSAGAVEYVAVTSERGGVLQIRNPWEAAADEQGKLYTDDVIAIPTNAGDTIRLHRAE